MKDMPKTKFLCGEDPAYTCSVCGTLHPSVDEAARCCGWEKYLLMLVDQHE